MTVSYGMQSDVFWGCSLWFTVPDEAKKFRAMAVLENFCIGKVRITATVEHAFYRGIFLDLELLTLFIMNV